MVTLKRGLAAVLGLCGAGALAGPVMAQSETLEIQASWPNSSTQFENLHDLAKRFDWVTVGRVKMEAMLAGQIAPAFEVPDAAHKSLISGALAEFCDKYKINLFNPPNELHKEFLAAWDRVAAREAEKNPVFKEGEDSQKKWASRVVPMKRFYFPNYSVAAEHYWLSK